ncbi:hypothetical protein [Gracilibacillus xinjiangensis]|uniref:Uncharacterized protein n=1 Tax=Gracilibacillus xinjiangensis TaxID=1193282 RepID=A0ABV8WX88_9BACI
MKSKSQNLIYLLFMDEGKGEDWNRGSSWMKFIFTFLYALMIACFSYLLDNDITTPVINFAVSFILGLLLPYRRGARVSNNSKVFSYIVNFVVLFLLGYLIVKFSTASIISKVGAGLILLTLVFLEKIERKYWISVNSSSNDF